MPKMYKLVSQDWTTHGGMRWNLGVTNKAKGSGKQMCTDGVLHCYKTPEQAVLFNPIHANIQNPILLEISCSEIIAQDGLKYACKEQTPLREIPLPILSTTQKAAFAIKVALLVYKEASFAKWATGWLDGTDRSAKSAESAAWSAESAARAAAWSTRSAAWSPLSAAWSAESAALSAESAAWQQIIEWVLGNIQ